jgi:hypothetical protein
VYVKYEPGANPACSTGAGGCSSAKVIGLLVFITFAMYWISEFLKNMIHVIISGVYGSWYFCSNNPPKNITRGAARRSLTYSFGSISLGSLVVAIINMLRQVWKHRCRHCALCSPVSHWNLGLGCPIYQRKWREHPKCDSPKVPDSSRNDRDTLSAISRYTARAMSPPPRPLGRKQFIYTKEGAQLT